jgi:outer membrane lipoprotein-sorting protein
MFSLIAIVILSGFLLGQKTGSISAVSSKNDAYSPLKPIDAKSDLKDVLRLMLNSNKKWESIIAEGVSRIDTGDHYFLRLEVIQQTQKGPYFVRAETGENDPTRPFVMINDGKKSWIMEKKLKIYNTLPFPSAGEPPEDLPTDNSPSNAIVPHPLELSVRSQLVSLIFPQGFAQQIALGLKEGKASIIGTDTVANRTTIVLQFDQDWASRHKIWIDRETGVILKQELFDKSGIENGLWYQQIEITGISLNSTKDKGQFSESVEEYSEVPGENFDKAVFEKKNK